MSLITFVLPVLAAVVLISVFLVLRAFFRVRRMPTLLDSTIWGLPVSSPAQAVSAAAPNPLGPPAQPAPEPEARGTLPGISLDRAFLNKLKQWYAGRECAVCQREIGPVHRTDPKPGLLTAGSPTPEILTWEKIPPDQLAAALESYLPVCASCVLAESFRLRFADRVTDRPDTTARDRAYY